MHVHDYGTPFIYSCRSQLITTYTGCPKKVSQYCALSVNSIKTWH